MLSGDNNICNISDYLENKEYDVSILDLLRLLDPSKTGKFMYILLNELRTIPAHEYGDYTDNLEVRTEHLPPVARVILNYLVELVGGLESVNSLHKFNNLLDRKLIKNGGVYYSNNQYLESMDNIKRILGGQVQVVLFYSRYHKTHNSFDKF